MLQSPPNTEGSEQNELFWVNLICYILQIASYSLLRDMHLVLNSYPNHMLDSDSKPAWLK